MISNNLTSLLKVVTNKKAPLVGAFSVWYSVTAYYLVSVARSAILPDSFRASSLSACWTANLTCSCFILIPLVALAMKLCFTEIIRHLLLNIYH